MILIDKLLTDNANNSYVEIWFDHTRKQFSVCFKNKYSGNIIRIMAVYPLKSLFEQVRGSVSGGLDNTEKFLTENAAQIRIAAIKTRDGYITNIKALPFDEDETADCVKLLSLNANGKSFADSLENFEKNKRLFAYNKSGIRVNNSWESADAAESGNE